MLRIGVKPVLAASVFGSALGLLLTGAIGIHPSHAGHLLPGMIVLGLSPGVGFPAFGNASLHELTIQGSSPAAGVQNAMYQTGRALSNRAKSPVHLRTDGYASMRPLMLGWRP